jgi:SCP-2 sterol transfer family
MATRTKSQKSVVDESLQRVAKKFSGMKCLRDGHIVLRLSGEGGGTYALKCEERKVSLVGEVPAGQHPMELIGDSRRVLSILEGKKDARTQFLAGGFRVRGDIRYVSDLGIELGILKEPI